MIVCVVWLTGLALSPTPGHSADIQGAETKDVQSKEERIYSNGKGVDKRPVLKSKPEPAYTDAARQNRIEGTVVLRCVFAATGEVKYFHVVSGLPYGLTEASIAAGKGIKFKPAMKDGKPVSYWMELRYRFWL
jgi:TonB family protein